VNRQIFGLMVLACLLGAARCQPSPLPPPPPEVGGTGSAGAPPSAGTGGAPLGADDCERAENKAAKLGCPLKAPKHATWAEACRNGRANGVDMQDDCVLEAVDCPAIHKCTSESAP
jgi:hypothetical protein